MKSLLILTASLMINSLCMAGENFPTAILSDTSLKLELPLPQKDKREKYIFGTSETNGFICHNYYREIEIKNKLFELKTKSELVPELEQKAIENKPPVTIMESNSYVTAIVGFLAGAIITLAVKKN